MAAITQRIPNFLGGVSQQIDELKLPGQVRECKNAYPEPTFGLIKRPGSQFTAELKETNGDLIDPGDLDDAEIFHIFRDNNEKYLAAIIGGNSTVLGDADFSNVKLLLHMGGANNSTTFTDSSPVGATVTSVGGAKISNVQSKFGGTSSFFDGVDDYLTMPTLVCSGKFTLECYTRITAHAGMGIFGAEDALGDSIAFGLSSTGIPQLMKANGTRYPGLTAVPLSQFVKLAFTRDSTNTVNYFVNGVFAGSAGVLKGPVSFSRLGHTWVGGTEYFNGYIDELRITDNVVRYRANYTVPTIAFPNTGTATSDNTIKIWSLIDGSAKTVNFTGNAKAYLSGQKGDYDTLTVNDYTFITNKIATVAAQPAPTYTYGARATIRLNSVEYGSTYTVSVTDSNGNALVFASYTTVEAEVEPQVPPIQRAFLSANTILTALAGTLTTGNLQATIIGTSIELVNTANTPFSITVKGGPSEDAISVYQDSVDNLGKLTTKTIHNRIVKVSNSVQVEDDYYLRFIANNGVSGEGFWEETVKPDISTGLDATTMPHQLVRNNDGTFTFGPATWEERLIGDDISNEQPSFVGNTINQLFFYNNRLGFLTDENVSMSQSGDYFNFYHNTALTVVASDPVDISASSVRPAVLHAVVPVAQGLLLFSRNQQFLMTGEAGILTPGNAVMKVISNYEMDIDTYPVDMGTTVSFLSKTPSYSRVFEMQTRGQDEVPIVVDISRVVPEWIPSTINQMVSSPQNSLLVMADSNTKDVRLFRFYFDGEERSIQSWFQWEMPGLVESIAIDEDICYVTTKQENSYVLSKLRLVQSPASSTFLTSDGSKVDPRLDLWFEPTTITYNSSDDYTRINLKYKHDTDLNLVVVTANPNDVTPSYSNSGLILTGDVINDAGQWYVRIDGYDLTSEEMIVGYTYDYNVVLPRFYYRPNQDSTTDYTAYLTVARAKFQVGLGGEVNFILSAGGRDSWTYTAAVNEADYYRANDIPFNATSLFTVPIHQRSTNFSLRVESDSPFPVSLVSMMWEGNYSPRFYARR